MPAPHRRLFAKEGSLWAEKPHLPFKKREALFPFRRRMRKGPQPRAGLRPLSIFLGKFPRQSVPRYTISQIRARPRISGECPADANTPAHALSNREIPCARLQTSLSIKGPSLAMSPKSGDRIRYFSPRRSKLRPATLLPRKACGFAGNYPGRAWWNFLGKSFAGSASKRTKPRLFTTAFDISREIPVRFHAFHQRKPHIFVRTCAIPQHLCCWQKKRRSKSAVSSAFRIK